MSKKLNRNDPCHCGSGKKYKNCHMKKDQSGISSKTGIIGMAVVLILGFVLIGIFLSGGNAGRRLRAPPQDKAAPLGLERVGAGHPHRRNPGLRQTASRQPFPMLHQHPARRRRVGCRRQLCEARSGGQDPACADFVRRSRF